MDAVAQTFEAFPTNKIMLYAIMLSRLSIAQCAASLRKQTINHSKVLTFHSSLITDYNDFRIQDKFSGHSKEWK